MPPYMVDMKKMSLNLQSLKGTFRIAAQSLKRTGTGPAAFEATGLVKEPATMKRTQQLAPQAANCTASQS